MPELPEVETVCWRLREGGHGEDRLVGQRLDVVEVTDPKLVRSGDPQQVVGSTVVDVQRRAKWITIVTDTPHKLLCHLVMTGDLHVVDVVPARFVRLDATLSSGQHLVFTDPRRLGHVDVVTDAAPFLVGLGPEPLASSFTPAVLAGLLRGRRPIKAVLLDQAVLAGLGNIYADESLHRAGIAPHTPAADLDAAGIGRLHAAVQHVLTQSIAAGRHSLAWRYQNRDAPTPFAVYERGGEPCLTCQTGLESTTLAGRTTVWCPFCQPG